MARVNLQEYCDEARELINSRAYEQAIAVCRHILQRYPKHIKAYQVLGEACLEKGDLQEAGDIFKRLLDHADPENFVAYAGLGVICEEKGQIAEAIWYMERALELAPNSEETRNALRRLRGKQEGREAARIKLNKAALARLYARGGQYRQAIEEFRYLLEEETNRDRMDLKVSLADALWRDGRREQAAEVARQILQTSPDCLKAILLLGMMQMEKGREEEGRAILARACSLDPENKVAQALFGERSPLPPQTIKITRVEQKPEAKAVPAVVPESVIPAVGEEVAPVAVLEEEASTEEKLEAEAVPAIVSEPLTPAIEAPAPLAVPEERVTPEEKLEAEAGPIAVSETIQAPLAEEEAKPAVILLEEAIPETAPLASAAITSAPLSDVERYKLRLEQKPKDDETRLALARAYCDQEQMKLALEQYSMLLHAKSKLLSEAISDVESIVASRPDNIEAHELLADLYARNGQLQRAVDRYRWILQRLAQAPA